MPRTRWEYLSITWQHSVGERPDGSDEYREDYFIYAPGASKSEHRDKASGKPLGVDLYNELGADGWEMVSETINESAAYWGGQRRGWPNTISFPIERRLLFKRLVERP